MMFFGEISQHMLEGSEMLFQEEQCFRLYTVTFVMPVVLISPECLSMILIFANTSAFIVQLSAYDRTVDMEMHSINNMIFRNCTISEESFVLTLRTRIEVLQQALSCGPFSTLESVFLQISKLIADGCWSENVGSSL